MTPEIKSLFETAESGPKGYNAYNRGTRSESGGIGNILPPNRDIDFSALTLKEVMALQKRPKSDPASVFAVGLYQLTPDTTQHAAEALRLNGDEKFTPELQDRIFSEYLLTRKRPAIEAFIKNEGKNSLKAAQHELSKEWAGMPDPYKQGASHYGKGTANKAHVDLETTRNFLEELRADYAQLRKDGLNATAAWAGLFDGREIERTPEVQVATGASAPKPASTSASTPAPKPSKDDATDLLDDLQDMPIFKSMQDALSKVTGPGLSKKLEDVLSKVDEQAILSAVGKAADRVTDSVGDTLKALNEKYLSSMSTHVPVQVEPKPSAAPVYPVPAKRPEPAVSVAVAEAPKNVAEVAPRQQCAPADALNQRLLHQVEAHLAGAAGNALGQMADADKQRLAHAIVAEARVSGFNHVAGLQVTQDKNGLVAFDGAPDSPASRRIYIDRVQAAAQSVERSASIAQNVAGSIDAALVHSNPPGAGLAMR